MKLLVTGGSGLVGSHFVKYYSGKSHCNLILSPNENQLDITSKQSVTSYIKNHEINAVIHFAAFTDVNQSEKQRNDRTGSCWKINVDGTNNLLEVILAKNKIGKRDIHFIYISTDGVFSGSKDNPGPYAEDKSTENNQNFLSWYGWTKKEAEELVKNNLKDFTIVRISNPVRAVYTGKLDYVRKILYLFDSGKLHPMFTDQYLTLTNIDEITKTLTLVIERNLFGIFHVSSPNIFTPYKLATLLIEKARQKKNVVKQTSIENFLSRNPSRYPQYGGLKVEQTEKKLNLRFLRWEEVIKNLTKQLSV